uniref:Pectinesterase inhibitor domain-containing protein n=1 Tax=Glycine max TaxID=3847 RepID=A0A0R0J213_SOYBN
MFRTLLLFLFCPTATLLLASSSDVNLNISSVFKDCNSSYDTRLTASNSGDSPNVLRSLEETNATVVLLLAAFSQVTTRQKLNQLRRMCVTFVFWVLGSGDDITF